MNTFISSLALKIGSAKSHRVCALKWQSAQKSTCLPGLKTSARSREDFAKDVSRRKLEDACDAYSNKNQKTYETFVI